MSILEYTEDDILGQLVKAGTCFDVKFAWSQRNYPAAVAHLKRLAAESITETEDDGGVHVSDAANTHDNMRRILAHLGQVHQPNAAGTFSLHYNPTTGMAHHRHDEDDTPDHLANVATSLQTAVDKHGLKGFTQGPEEPDGDDWEQVYPDDDGTKSWRHRVIEKMIADPSQIVVELVAAGGGSVIFEDEASYDVFASNPANRHWFKPGHAVRKRLRPQPN